MIRDTDVLPARFCTDLPSLGPDLLTALGPNLFAPLELDDERERGSYMPLCFVVLLLLITD